MQGGLGPLQLTSSSEERIIMRGRVQWDELVLGYNGYLADARFGAGQIV